MKIRVVDYIGNPGGGLRYSVQLLFAFVKKYPDVCFEVVSYGSAYDRYKNILKNEKKLKLLASRH